MRNRAAHKGATLPAAGPTQPLSSLQRELSSARTSSCASACSPACRAAVSTACSMAAWRQRRVRPLHHPQCPKRASPTSEAARASRPRADRHARARRAVSVVGMSMQVARSPAGQASSDGALAASSVGGSACACISEALVASASARAAPVFRHGTIRLGARRRRGGSVTILCAGTSGARTSVVRPDHRPYQRSWLSSSRARSRSAAKPGPRGARRPTGESVSLRSGEAGDWAAAGSAPVDAARNSCGGSGGGGACGSAACSGGACGGVAARGGSGSGGACTAVWAAGATGACSARGGGVFAAAALAAATVTSGSCSSAGGSVRSCRAGCGAPYNSGAVQNGASGAYVLVRPTQRLLVTRTQRARSPTRTEDDPLPLAPKSVRLRRSGGCFEGDAIDPPRAGAAPRRARCGDSGATPASSELKDCTLSRSTHSVSCRRASASVLALCVPRHVPAPHATTWGRAASPLGCPACAACALGGDAQRTPRATAHLQHRLHVRIRVECRRLRLLPYARRSSATK